MLDRKHSFLLLEVENPDSTKEIISQLKAKDGVVTLVTLFNNKLLIALFDDEEKIASRQITSMGFKANPLIVPEIRVPQTNFQMLYIVPALIQEIV